MKQNINIEAEGNELILKNKAGDYVIIPKKYRLEVQDMIKESCHGCIDKLIDTLPVMEDYAEDGSLYSEYLTPDSSTKKHPSSWWLKLKAKQKQKEVAPIFQGHPLPVTEITAEPIGKGKYLAEFDKQNPRQPYQETNEYIRRFQPEKVVQKQAWRDVERNRLRDNYAESYMIRNRDLKTQQEYEKNKDSLPWWKKRVEGVNTTSQQKEQILEQQAKGRLEWSNKPLEHKAGWIANETAMALVPELSFLKGTAKGAQIAKNISNTLSDASAVVKCFGRKQVGANLDETPLKPLQNKNEQL